MRPQFVPLPVTPEQVELPPIEEVETPAPILTDEEKVIASIRLARQLVAVWGVYKKTLMVCRAVAHIYGVRPDDLLGERRFARFVTPRQVAMTIARDLLGYSFPEIGRAFGGRHHTTVLHAFNKFHDVVAPLVQATAGQSA